MTDEQARELFSVAVEGELEGAELVAFETYLDQHPELAREYDAFRRMIDDARKLNTDVHVPDLLPGVQRKLRNRRERRGLEHLRGRGFPTTMTLGLVVAALAVVLWLAFTTLSRLTGRSDRAPTPDIEAPVTDAP